MDDITDEMKARFAPMTKVFTVRESSLLAGLLAAVIREEGVTLEELQAALAMVVELAVASLGPTYTYGPSFASAMVDNLDPGKESQ